MTTPERPQPVAVPRPCPIGTRLRVEPVTPAERTHRLPNPRYSALALWHLLSLDAPSVAALWAYFVARCSGVRLPWTAPTAMFLAVWLIYASDRLLDARALDANAAGFSTPQDLEIRHYFHHRHRSRFLTAICITTLALVCMLYRVEPQSLHLYVMLAVLLGAWMLIIHASQHPCGAARRLPKEVAVGIFFPAAVFVPTVARMPALKPALLPVAVLFGLTCALNCLYLYAWEHPNLPIDAHWTTRWAVRHLSAVAWSLILTAIVWASVSFSVLAESGMLPAVACALSASAFVLLNHYRDRISATHLRAGADMVLLTPILLLPFVHL